MKKSKTIDTLGVNRLAKDLCRGNLPFGIPTKGIRRPVFKINESSVRLRWEFMRRDPEVKKLYYEGPGLSTKDKKYFEVLRAFHIRSLPLPDITKTFDQLIETGGSKNSIIWQLSSYHPVAVEYGLLGPMEKVSIRADVHYLRQAKEIFCELIDEINLKKRANRELEINLMITDIQQRKTLRQRKDYDQILKVGILKDEHPAWTDLEIAEEINQVRNNEPDATKQRIYTWRKEYKRLVNGGWRDIL